MNASLNELHTVSVSPGLCKRERYRQSDCRLCEDICPDKAISLSPGPIISEACSSCGLCVNVCPTETFHDVLDTEQIIMDQIGLRFKKSQVNNRANTEGKVIYFHCAEAQKAQSDSIRISCAGSLTENIILASALEGVNEIRIANGECSQCAKHKGVDLLEDVKESSKPLLESLGLNTVTFSHEASPLKLEPVKTLSRREFFSNVTTAIKTQAATAVVEKSENLKKEFVRILDADNYKQKRPSPRKEKMLALIEREPATDIPLHHRPEYRWASVIIDDKKCTACRTCVTFCPTGALFNKSEENQANGVTIERHFNSTLCSNCGLCVESCYVDAIHFNSSYSMQDNFSSEPRLLAKIEVASCMICGESMKVSEGEVCSTCRKRQVAPLFM